MKINDRQRHTVGLWWEVRRARWGLACGLALAVRPAGSAEAPGSTARAGGRVPRSGAPLTLEGPTRTMRGVPALVLVTFARRSAHLARC